jgi:RIO-like serine/threonine protein kinase
MGTPYYHLFEVGRGSTSVVYCYSDASDNKIAIKVARNGDTVAQEVIEREKCTHMDLMEKGLSCIP